MTQTTSRALSVLLLIGSLLIANALPTVAQETAAITGGSGQIQTRTSPWNISCTGAVSGIGLDCEMSRAMVVGDNNTLLLRLTVNRLAASAESSLLLQLPHGIYLPDGVSMGVDENPPSNEVVQTCDTAGCYVGLATDRAFLPSLQQGATLKVSFQNLNRAVVTIDLSLEGFTKAYAQMTGD